MKRIILSQFYQLRCNFSLLRVGLLFAAVMVVMGITICSGSEGVKDVCTLIIESDGILWVFESMFIGAITAFVCAGDFGDRDINYELMNGHTRKTIYMARALTCVLLTAFAGVVVTFMPIIGVIVTYGWGDRISVTDGIIRLGLFFFPYIRVASFFAMLSFIIKKTGTVITIGMISMGACGIMTGIVENFNPFAVSFFNMMKLTDICGYSVYNVVPGKGVVDYMAVEGSLSLEMIVYTIVISLVVAGVYLMAGYGFFKGDDLD